MACKHPPLPNKPGDNWVSKQGGLPEMIDCVARAIFHSGKSKGDVSKAVQLAVGAVENWASGQGNVTPRTRAKAEAAVAEFKAKAAKSKAETAAKNLSNESDKHVDLAVRRRDIRTPGDAKDPLMNLGSAVARLRKRPEFKNASEKELHRIAAARILRRAIRRQLGITDLKKLPPAQLQQLKKLGLIGSSRASVGQTTSYTIQRGPRKGRTIQVRYGKSGHWTEVQPKAQTIP